MKIVVAGGHGKIAMLLHPILKEKGHKVTGLIRKEEQVDDLKEAGAESVVVDIEMEDDISEFVGNADAVVFAAGAGPGSSKDRKWSVDRDGAIKLIEAAKKNGVDKYVMISAMGLETPRGDDVFQVYQQAKAQADKALRNSGLNYVIVKPGRLTNDEGTGRVKIAEKLDRGEIPREDVARVIAEVLDNNSIKNVEFDLLSGEDDINKALLEFV